MHLAQAPKLNSLLLPVTILPTSHDKIMDGFYSRVLAIPVLKEIIDDHSTADRLRMTLLNHDGRAVR